MRNKPNFGPPGSYISTSQLEMLGRCGKQFEFRYMDGLIEPGNLKLAKGNGVHGAAQQNFEQKIETDVDWPVADFVEAAVTAYEGEVRGDLLLSPDEKSLGPKKAIAAQKDRTAELAEAFHLKVSPDYHPVAVEEPFSIDLPSAQTRLVGVIDLQDIVGQIIDHKTGKRAKSQQDADESVQLTSYAAARARKGNPATGIVLESLSQSDAGNISRKSIKTSRGPGDFSALAARIVAAKRVIESGVFMPAQAGFGSPCGWCGFRHRCPYVSKDRQPTDT